MSSSERIVYPDTLQVIDDMGKERTIRQEEFWMYEADALPDWITPQEHAAKQGLEKIIAIHGEEIGER